MLAQWNSDAEGHIGLCKLLSKLGIASLRISLPYHDARMPPELTRADYIVSSNIVRTLQVCRQAVRDVRLALWWLRDQGYERLGLLGTSLGSCLSYLTTCHEPLVRAQALNHVSPFFGDVVWRGLSTEHVRQGLEGHVDVDQLRDLWRPISPWSFIDRLRDQKTLMVYAKYDLTFPVDLSLKLIDEMKRRGMPLEVRGAAVRALLDRRRAVQISRRLVPRKIPRQEPLEPLAPRDISKQANERVVDGAGERLHERRDLAGVHRLGDGDRIGQQQPDRGAGDHGGKQPDDADEAEEPVRKS